MPSNQSHAIRLAQTRTALKLARKQLARNVDAIESIAEEIETGGYGRAKTALRAVVDEQVTTLGATAVL